MNRADYEARLQDCFDRRLDPLDDAALQAWLEVHPEALEAFAQQRRLLQAMPAVMPLAPSRHRRWPWLVAAAMLIAALAMMSASRARSPSPAAIDAADFRVLGSSLTEETSPCGATLHWRARELLLHTATTRLEIVEQGSALR